MTRFLQRFTSLFLKPEGVVDNVYHRLDSILLQLLAPTVLSTFNLKCMFLTIRSVAGCVAFRLISKRFVTHPID